MKPNWPTKKLGKQKTFDEIVHSWLKDEWYLPHYNQIRQNTPSRIIENPNFSDPNENKTRLELLRCVRQPMIDLIPSDTQWYVTDFNRGDLNRTFIVPSSDWLPITNNSYSVSEAVKNVGSNLDHADRIRKIKDCANGENVSKNLILVASSPESLFTVIEGNHRVVAFVSEVLNNTETNMIVEEIFLGISPQMKNYIWHIESRFQNET